MLQIRVPFIETLLWSMWWSRLRSKSGSCPGSCSVLVVDANYLTVPGSFPPAPVTPPPSRPPPVPSTPRTTADTNLGSYSPSTGGLTNQVTLSSQLSVTNSGQRGAAVTLGRSTANWSNRQPRWSEILFIDDIKVKCEKPSNIFLSQLEYPQWAC